MNNDFTYKIISPPPFLSDFVESFWMLANLSEEDKDIVVLPDGRFDIIFSYAAKEPYQVTLTGLGATPGQVTFPERIVMFAVSFKLLAVEYLLDHTIAGLLNSASLLPDDFWGITAGDLDDFDGFCDKVSAKMRSLIKGNIDSRKQKLFDLIYSSKGSLSVKELSEQAWWSSRQINRYFNQQFGISLKSYCNILRFRASLQQIKEGNFFPEQNFTDQTHFIKEIKKYTGVIPKELYKNKNDRFILFSTLPKK